MGRRGRSVLILVGVALLAFVVFRILWSNRGLGPVVHERHLSEWVEVFGSNTKEAGLYVQAEEAVVQLGTNCFPYLLEWIQSEDSPWRDMLPASAARYIADSPTLEDRLRTRKERRILGSHYAFALLKEKATPAVIAELTKLMNATNAPKTATRARYFLSSPAVHDYSDAGVRTEPSTPQEIAPAVPTNAPGR